MCLRVLANASFDSIPLTYALTSISTPCSFAAFYESFSRTSLSQSLRPSLCHNGQVTYFAVCSLHFFHCQRLPRLSFPTPLLTVCVTFSLAPLLLLLLLLYTVFALLRFKCTLFLSFSLNVSPWLLPCPPRSTKAERYSSLYLFFPRSFWLIVTCRFADPSRSNRG